MLQYAADKKNIKEYLRVKKIQELNDNNVERNRKMVKHTQED